MSVHHIDALENRASAKQCEFLLKLMSERVWAGRPQHEAGIRVMCVAGDLPRMSARMYIDMMIKSPRKRG